MKNKQWNETEATMLARLYHRGYTLIQLADIFEVSTKQIKSKLDALKYTQRITHKVPQRHEPITIYQLDYHTLEYIDTYNSIYEAETDNNLPKNSLYRLYRTNNVIKSVKGKCAFKRVSPLIPTEV